MHEENYLTHRIYRYSKVNTITSFPSWKHPSAQLTESTLEKEISLINEFDPRVVKRLTQPFTIDFGDFRYTPDALTREIDGTDYIEEVKPESELAKPNVAKRLRKVECRLHQRGINFRILTDKLTSNRLYISNLWLLYRHRNHSHDLTWLPAANRAFGGRCLWDELHTWLNTKNIYGAALYNAIAQNKLSCDLQSQLNGRTELVFNAQ